MLAATLEKEEIMESKEMTAAGKPVDEIFVFGSNLSGIHGAGAAKAALDEWGADFYNGLGFQGKSYAIPTKDERIETLPLDIVKVFVRAFLAYAVQHPDTRFLVTRIGCGLAGFKDNEVAPLFRAAPTNCRFSANWKEWVSPKAEFDTRLF